MGYGDESDLSPVSHHVHYDTFTDKLYNLESNICLREEHKEGSGGSEVMNENPAGK